MSAVKLNLVQGTSEWLSARKHGVGASETPAILGLSPYKTKRDLWFEKSGFDDEDITESKKFLFSKGHDIEEKIRQMYFEKIGIEFTPAFYKKDEIFLASLDGENKNEGVLEAKYTTKDVVKNALKGEVPVHHRIQVQQQLLVTGYDKAHYICTNDGKDYVSVIVRPDKKIQSQITDEVKAFWELVLTGKCPELTDKDTMYITDADQRLLFRNFKSLYEKKKEIESEYKALEEQIKEICKHPKTSCAGVKVTKYEVKGNIQYRNIPDLKNINLDMYRSRPSLRTKITFGGEE